MVMSGDWPVISVVNWTVMNKEQSSDQEVGAASDEGFAEWPFVNAGITELRSRILGGTSVVQKVSETMVRPSGVSEVWKLSESLSCVPSLSASCALTGPSELFCEYIF